MEMVLYLDGQNRNGSLFREGDKIETHLNR